MTRTNMQRNEQHDNHSVPPGPFPTESPPFIVPMSPPPRVRPPEEPGQFARRRASTSAAAGLDLARHGGFPVLQLTNVQIEQLRVMETKLLAQYLERYDTFVELNQRTVDTGLWKLARQTNGVKAYKRRDAISTRRSSLSIRSGLRGRATTVINHRETDDPMLLVMGSIEGTLEDVLYGAVWNSRDERSTRTYYTKDGIVDASVLASLERPSSMNPFRTLAIKWSLKRAMRSAAVIKDRDFVFMGSTGTIRSRTDERIGYELRHSLKIPTCPPIETSSIIRAEIMSCSFFRQMRGGRVEVFHQASFDAGGDLLSVLTWNHAIDNYIGFASIIECSYTKKLVRAVQWSSENPPPKTEQDPQERPWDPEERRCCVCAQPGRSLQRKCAICHMWVCSHCSVRKEIFTPLPGRPSVARCFCKTCLLKVQRDDPTDYVLRELEQFEHRTATEYSHSPDIAVLDPHNEEIPPPPPPPPSDASEAVFFAIDASPLPPNSPDAVLPLPGRRRQGSLPMQPPLLEEPLSQNERVSHRKRFVSEANTENNPPNTRGSVNRHSTVDDRERDLATVGRSRRQSAATSTRATHASKTPHGEILLKSDSSHKKWQDREIEQQNHTNAYSVRTDEAMHLRKTDVVKPKGSSNRRRMTVLGSEAFPPPPQPQLQSHRKQHHTVTRLTSVRLASERRGSVEELEQRRSLSHKDLDVPTPTNSSVSDSEVPPRTSRPATIAETSNRPSRKHSKARAIYANLRAARPRASTADEIDEVARRRFTAQYEELVPRASSVLNDAGRAPLSPVSPKPKETPPPRQVPEQKASPPRPPPSARRSNRAPPPPRPDGPLQVRLSLLERHQHEQLQREYQQHKEQQMWMDYENDQYERDRHARKQQQQGEYASNNQVETPEQPPQEDPADPLSTAREQDELHVNALLAELCEIARMTRDYTNSASSSVQAVSSSTHDRSRQHA